MNPTLTVSQLVILGLATVAGSFSLNWLLIRTWATRVDGKLDHLAELLEAPNGVLVRLGQNETRVDGLERDVGELQRDRRLA